MFNKPIKPRIIGCFVLLPAILIILGTIMAVLFVPAFAFASGVNFLAIIPFLILIFFSFLLSGICIYIAFRYFKNKPFGKNRTLGQLFVYLPLVYLLYSLLICLVSNLTGNFGGFGPTLMAILFTFILLPLGLGLKNGYK